MSISDLESTKMECLQEAGLRELPPPIGEGYTKTWLRAIVLVTKVGGFRSYVICDNDGYGKPVVKIDPGRCAMIVRVDSIHPITEADRTVVPRFKDEAEILHYLTKNKYEVAEIKALLNTEGKNEEQIAADKTEIERRINEIALSMEKRKAEETKRVKKIKEFAEKAKGEKKNGKDDNKTRRGNQQARKSNSKQL